MAESKEAVLSHRVALRKYSIQTWEQEAHMSALWLTSGGAQPGLPHGSRAGEEARLCSRSCLQRDPFLKFEVRNLNTFHLELVLQHEIN